MSYSDINVAHTTIPLSFAMFHVAKWLSLAHIMLSVADAEKNKRKELEITTKVSRFGFRANHLPCFPSLYVKLLSFGEIGRRQIGPAGIPAKYVFGGKYLGQCFALLSVCTLCLARFDNDVRFQFGNFVVPTPFDLRKVPARHRKATH